MVLLAIMSTLSHVTPAEFLHGRGAQKIPLVGINIRTPLLPTRNFSMSMAKVGPLTNPFRDQSSWLRLPNTPQILFFGVVNIAEWGGIHGAQGTKLITEKSTPVRSELKDAPELRETSTIGLRFYLK
eukprot:scaffold14054_cov103-Skeletonema_dohrnii-CCMP3373.AAC.3